MILIREGHGAQHGAEHFFLRQTVHDRHVAQQRRCLVEAGFGCFFDNLPLRHHGYACDLSVAQKIPHALLLALANQRPDVEVQPGRADAQVCKGLAKLFEQRLVNAFFNQQP